MSAKVNRALNRLKAYYHNNPRQVRRNIAILFMFGLLGNGMLQFTSTPRFCNSCHEMKPAYQSWQISIHSEITCESCHMPPGVINFFKHKVRGVRGLYIHFAASGFEPPQIQGEEKALVNESCGRCHSFNRTMGFSGGLYVPHKKHKEEGLLCTTCHDRLVHGQGNQKARKPTMDTCMQCHNGTRAPEGCGVCHITLAITEERDR